MADSWVVDASVLVDLVIKGESWQASRDALAGHQLHAPAHVDVEVISALVRLQRASVITKVAAGRALTNFTEAPITRHEVTGLVSVAWQLSSRLRVADSFYVALARRLDTRVLTLDARLARASNDVVLVTTH